MKTKKLGLLTALLLAVSGGVGANAQCLLPMPQKVEWQKGKVSVENVRVEQANAPVGRGTLRLLEDWLVKGVITSKPSTILCFRALPNAANDEAYRLSVAKDSIVLSAATPLGYLRGAQTLLQLTENSSVRCCHIEDAPAFEWRGVMLDVSRHFLSVDFLKKHIDVLASYKINRLHLHLTDAAGWRMEIKRYPRLSGFAAWRPQESWKEWWNGDRRYVEEGTPGAYGGYYTQDELRSLVAYAAERGICIIPEIEMPAHSEEVLTAYPELSCTHEPYKQADFCPGSVATYDFLEHVLEEVMDVFPSKYIHVGGDEAAKASWHTCPLCQHKMKELGLKDVEGLQAHLIAHMGRFLKTHNRELVGWDEVISDSLTSNSTVMVWRGMDFAKQAVKKGYDVVLSPGTNCYFDFYQDAPPTQPEAIGGYLTLEKVYAFNPLEGIADKKHVKGVQGNVWAEYIQTPEHREYMIYPRALAIAEIGWNGTEKKDYAEFRQRAVVQTDKLRAAGVNAFDLRGEQGERKEHLTPARHKALGAKVIYNLPYSNNYAAGGEKALTDGLRGGWANNDGYWQGFIDGDRFDVTIDLGKRKAIRSVSTNFMQVCGPEIFFPATYVVSVSDDGKTFRTLGEQNTPVVKTPTPDIRTYKWAGKTQGRYVRVQAKAGKFGGWLFADEVEVR